MAQKLPIFLHKYLKALKSDPSPIAPIELVNISHFASGFPHLTGLLDRFKITFAYIGKQFTWEVIFNGKDPSVPPDFIFDDAAFFPQIEFIPSLLRWGSDSSDLAFTVLLGELMKEFVRHHISLMELHENVLLQLEFATITAFRSSIYCPPAGKSASRDVLLIVEIPLPTYDDGPVGSLIRSQPISISVEYRNTAAASTLSSSFTPPTVSTKLLVPGPLLKFFKRNTPPAWTSQTVLKDYIAATQTMLLSDLKSYLDGISLRRQYFAALLALCGNSVLEYDEETFTKMAFLFELKQFSTIVFVELDSSLFPSKQPKVTLQSIYHERNGHPCEKVLAEYPYSPRWPAIEMASRLRALLEDSMPLFREEYIKFASSETAGSS